MVDLDEYMFTFWYFLAIPCGEELASVDALYGSMLSRH
jgi:hypothetical protein